MTQNNSIPMDKNKLDGPRVIFIAKNMNILNNVVLIVFLSMAV